ncbi:hypothetical protein [Clostridium estertheticum]|uniref:hypothetical protein n=1 Tax=Clostridium estertheticum TaxID=238834 RepID=UPI001C0D3C9D|nr:hypothetical protein [Clostridium estertheticum]MBU3072840.1 hypothetical protein [Clostridium estertheticum]MBU3163123.1 hypothetical protein [Clostridium estertheticum]
MLLVYKKNDISVNQISNMTFVISAVGFGELLKFKLPSDGKFMENNRVKENNKYMEALVKCVEARIRIRGNSNQQL